MINTVGFIGTGTMGKPMAGNLIRAGFKIVAYDIDPAPLKDLVGLGARAASSAKDAALDRFVGCSTNSRM